MKLSQLFSVLITACAQIKDENNQNMISWVVPGFKLQIHAHANWGHCLCSIKGILVHSQ